MNGGGADRAFEVQFFRRAVADTEIAGQPVERGDRVILLYPSANRDEAVFDEPFRFDITRDPNPHVAFGAGVHFCLGAPLSRLEINVALESLARRIDHFELDEGNDLRYHPSFVLRGLVRLDVRVHRAEVSA